MLEIASNLSGIVFLVASESSIIKAVLVVMLEGEDVNVKEQWRV